MKTNRTMPGASIIPELGYDDVGAAIEWLCEASGFRVRWPAGDHRAQLAFGNGCAAVTGHVVPEDWFGTSVDLG
jgi:hypothetical protein